MKKVLFFLLVFVIAYNTKAQKVEVKEAGNALSVVIYEKSIDDVKKEWKSLMKKNDGKVESENNKMTAKSAVIKSMSGGTFDVTATFEEVKKGEVKMDVVFDPVITATSAAPSKEKYMAEGKSLVKGFAVELTKDGITELLKLEKKSLSKMTGQQQDLVQRKEKLESEIQKDQDEIKKDQDEIQQNIASQKLKAEEIDTQNKMVDMVQKRLSGVE